MFDGAVALGMDPKGLLVVWGGDRTEVVKRRDWWCGSVGLLEVWIAEGTVGGQGYHGVGWRDYKKIVSPPDHLDFPVHQQWNGKGMNEEWVKV